MEDLRTRSFTGVDKSLIAPYAQYDLLDWVVDNDPATPKTCLTQQELLDTQTQEVRDILIQNPPTQIPWERHYDVAAPVAHQLSPVAHQCSPVVSVLINTISSN
jgi:hypothetical protein